jgi:hypothetical protein
VADTAIPAAEQAVTGPKQLGKLLNAEHGVRVWNGQLLLIGHHDLDQTADLLHRLFPHTPLHPTGWHHHVHLVELLPPATDQIQYIDWRGWIYCAIGDPGAVPITHFMFQQHPCADG